jgi:uncharacterized membrane protein YqgA involved in biofilm formation
MENTHMLGTLVNTAAVILGALIGLLLKKGLPQRLGDTIMKGLGLCTLYIGITGLLKESNTLILILSMVLGSLIGELLDLEGRLTRLGELAEKRFQKTGEKTTFAEGFVSGSLLFCVGAMAIVGSLQSGLQGDHTMLFNKSMLDFVAAILFASALGTGVILSALSVLVYQGTITLLARWIAPYLSDRAIEEMVCVGSLILIAMAFNIIGITKLKVMNYVPAIFLPILFCLFL